MKKIFVLFLVFLPFSSYATGGFASIGKDIRCGLELSAIGKSFPCDSGGSCSNPMASAYIVFKKLEGDLSKGLKGVSRPVSITINNSGTDSVNKELLALAHQLQTQVVLSYKNKVFQMTLESLNQSHSEKFQADFSEGARYAYRYLSVPNFSKMQNGLRTVTAWLRCGASQTHEESEN